MIKKLYPNAEITRPFEPTGISNIIQAVEDNEILYVKAKSEEQLNKLIDLHLPKTFKGLVVSPFKPSRKDLNYCKFDAKKIDEDINKKVEYFYPLKESMPPVFGVTGTNGKTSCCWLFSELLKQENKRVLYLGTVGTFLAGEKKEDKIITTTPSYLELRKIYFKYRDKVDAITIEVSSHALEQERLGPVVLDVAAWTNFTQDHLDYHKTMDSYFNAKKKIIDITKDKKVLILDSESEINKRLEDNAIKTSEYVSENNLPTVKSHLGQGFIVKNIEISIAAGKKLGFLSKEIDFNLVKLPPGRFEVVTVKDRTFIIDYAHTPDALEKLMEQVEDIYKEVGTYLLFGCGGDRDRSKRALMGTAAEKNNFNIILTSDNPRSENPEQILKDISKGMTKEHLQIVDRKKAILKAFELSNAGDVIVIAGKGHEDYQEIEGKRYHFSDVEVVRNLNDKA